MKRLNSKLHTVARKQSHKEEEMLREATITPDRVTPHVMQAFLSTGQLEGAQRRSAVQGIAQQQGNAAVQRAIDTARRSASAGPEGGPLEDDLAQQIQAARSGGQPLDAHLRAEAEQSLGADLSQVRVHTDQTAATISRQLGARAFTTGRDIFFGAEATPADRALLLHEATHTIQQGMSEDVPSGIGAADTAHEQDAEAAIYNVAAEGGENQMLNRAMIDRDDDSGGGDGGTTTDAGSSSVSVAYPGGPHGTVQSGPIDFSNNHTTTGNAFIENDVLLFEFDNTTGGAMTTQVDLSDDSGNAWTASGSVTFAEGTTGKQYIEFSNFPNQPSGDVMGTCNYTVTLTNDAGGSEGVHQWMNIYRG